MHEKLYFKDNDNENKSKVKDNNKINIRIVIIKFQSVIYSFTPQINLYKIISFKFIELYTFTQ